MHMEREVVNNERKQRFEVYEDGNKCYLEYEVSDEEIDLMHTFVPPDVSNRGIAADLVKFALQYAEEHKLKVIPTCSYVKAYIDRNS